MVLFSLSLPNFLPARLSGLQRPSPSITELRGFSPRLRMAQFTSVGSTLSPQLVFGGQLFDLSGPFLPWTRQTFADIYHQRKLRKLRATDV